MSGIKNDGAGTIQADGTFGYSAALSDTIDFDLSATYYAYPGHTASNALEVTAKIEASRGPLAGSLGASFAPPQRGTSADDGLQRANLYLFAAATYKIEHSPISIRAGIGRERGPWDMIEHECKWDYALGLEAETGQASFSLDYIGSNAGSDGLLGAATLHF